MPEKVLLTRERLVDLFDRLNGKLTALNTTAELYVVVARR